MKKKKLILAIVAVVAAMAIISGSIAVIVMNREDTDSNNDTAAKHGELYIRDLLSGKKIDDVIKDPEWAEAMVDSTEEYVVVNASEFNFSEEIGIAGGYSLIYFDKSSREIDMIQHNYVAYTDGEDGKSLLNEITGNVKSRITELLGTASQPFMLLPLSGEYQDFGEISLDEMIAKTLEGGYVMYTLYECDGLKYEMNIMYSDATAYTMVWIYDESVHCTDESHEH